MQVEKIKENKTHHYSYKTKEGTWTGKGKVLEKIKKPNGWKIVLFDKDNNKTLQLFPSQIVK